MSEKIRITGSAITFAPSETPRTDAELERISDLGHRQKISQSEWEAWKLMLAWARKLEVELRHLQNGPAPATQPKSRPAKPAVIRPPAGVIVPAGDRP